MKFSRNENIIKFKYSIKTTFVQINMLCITIFNYNSVYLYSFAASDQAV